MVHSTYRIASQAKATNRARTNGGELADPWPLPHRCAGWPADPPAGSNSDRIAYQGRRETLWLRGVHLAGCRPPARTSIGSRRARAEQRHGQSDQ